MVENVTPFIVPSLVTPPPKRIPSICLHPALSAAGLPQFTGKDVATKLCSHTPSSSSEAEEWGAGSAKAVEGAVAGTRLCLTPGERFCPEMDCGSGTTSGQRARDPVLTPHPGEQGPILITRWGRLGRDRPRTCQLSRTPCFWGGRGVLLEKGCSLPPPAGQRGPQLPPSNLRAKWGTWAPTCKRGEAGTVRGSGKQGVGAPTLTVTSVLSTQPTAHPYRQGPAFPPG